MSTSFFALWTLQRSQGSVTGWRVTALRITAPYLRRCLSASEKQYHRSGSIVIPSGNRAERRMRSYLRRSNPLPYRQGITRYCDALSVSLSPPGIEETRKPLAGVSASGVQPRAAYFFAAAVVGFAGVVAGVVGVGVGAGVATASFFALPPRGLPEGTAPT